MKVHPLETDKAKHFRTKVLNSGKDKECFLDDVYNNVTWKGLKHMPIATYDCGFGLSQLTQSAEKIEQIWDYGKNLDRGYYWLSVTKKNKAYDEFLEKVLKDVELYEDVNGLVVTPFSLTYGGYDWKMGQGSFSTSKPIINKYFNVALQSNEKSLLDACVIRAYNGGGFIKFNNGVYSYKDPNDYVKKIASTVVPQ